MQDRQHSDIDPVFIDNAWSRMEEQLDIAMPVQDGRRRRMVAWWLVLGALLLSVGFGVWLWAGVDLKPLPAQEPQPANTNIPIASTANDTKTSPPIENQVTSAAVVEVGPGTATVASSSGGQVANSSARANNYSPTNTNQRLPSETGNIAADDSPTHINNSTTAPSLVNNTSSPEEDAGANAEESMRAREVFLTPPLPSTQFNEITWQDLPAEDAVSLVASSSPSKPIHLFTDLAYGQGIDDNAQLIRIGAGVQVALARNWRVEGALQFEQLERDGFPWPALADNNRSIVDLQSAGNPTGAYFGVASVDSILQNISSQRFHLPVELRFTPGSSRWSFTGGGYVSYYHRAIVNAASPESNVLLDESFGLAGADIYAPEVVSSINAAFSNAGSSQSIDPRRWAFGWTAGINFRLAPRWELQTHLRSALTDWPNKGSQVGAHSIVDVAVRYYWR